MARGGVGSIEYNLTSAARGIDNLNPSPWLKVSHLSGYSCQMVLYAFDFRAKHLIAYQKHG